MKKNLMTLMFVFLFACIGTVFAKAEVPNTSISIAKFSKKSTAANEIKLERIKSIIKIGEAGRKRMCMDCLDDLEFLEGVAEDATYYCGGADGTGAHNEDQCNSWLDYATAVGNAFEDAGCDSFLPEGHVEAKNINRKIWIIRKKTIEIS
ncbi:MAG: hypothetical protein ACR2N3_04010 [Pyrinomonadaceae bacterium]